ncbi:hypothetical protein [Cereibacter azotoformans]|uniref:Uncharacterized protein n=1 Tax=Cereibacter azotoformans TaxID=43057 RepID=A0A2T5JSI2_9RHOB|nr:hypothetical protein [Cereibacter azotoformans]MBO4168909.1 hypothetical protein [Cereibacter azotoformans]PTR11185.1 hypothetical protein C8J28_12846 [Cereibacter azotoformans]
MFALNLRRRLALIICPELIGLTNAGLHGDSEERQRWLEAERLHRLKVREYGMFDIETARQTTRARRLEIAAARLNVTTRDDVVGSAVEQHAGEAVPGLTSGLGLGA